MQGRLSKAGNKNKVAASLQPKWWRKRFNIEDCCVVWVTEWVPNAFFNCRARAVIPVMFPCNFAIYFRISPISQKGAKSPCARQTPICIFSQTKPISLLGLDVDFYHLVLKIRPHPGPSCRGAIQIALFSRGLEP